MVKSSGEKKKDPHDNEQWASRYLSNGDNLKIDDAMLAIKLPSLDDDLDYDTLQILCIKICKKIALNDGKWLKFIYEKSPMNYQKMTGMKNYVMNKLS